MSHHHDIAVPRAALLGAGALVVLSLVLAAAGSLGLIGNVSPTTVSASGTHRDFRFEDRADGGIDVLEPADGRLVTVLAGGEHGFIRGMLRNLARERRQYAVGSGPAFRLTRWSDGRLSLTDLATGRVAALDGFGATNRAAFERLLILRVNSAAGHSTLPQSI